MPEERVDITISALYGFWTLTKRVEQVRLSIMWDEVSDSISFLRERFPGLDVYENLQITIRTRKDV